ncbi:hypothetical protein Dsin_006536 [Dipteronia sinensis]|uniref:DnaJ homologue subfamily C member 28 conserved domain-containing protein n=1 Tax=Dipteronia sinensis TaxID=43782 RepID=A0AAE0EFZ4_9ROSI|nr:hypothetical protein Dsin_006536 [Dipteronia sinensis]
MATRLARALSLYSVERSTAEISSGVSRPRSRWASSKKMNNTSDRLSGVTDVVNDRKLPPELRGQRNSVRSETDIQGVVEQRIWHSMEEGQFENLPGKGKPLNLNTNPHADPAEDTLYRILSNNGCAPEWVQLNKDIRTQVSEWRLALNRAWAIKRKWADSSELLQKQLRDINNKVFRYNLIVPFGRQMSGLKWDKEVARLEECNNNDDL